MMTTIEAITMVPPSAATGPGARIHDSVRAGNAIAIGTPHPWADSSAICAFRQVITDSSAPAHDPRQPPTVSINLTL
jgi:hypothetical protein